MTTTCLTIAGVIAAVVVAASVVDSRNQIDVAHV
jgi:hypothetical protein